jgi:hypothetical protein
MYLRFFSICLFLCVGAVSTRSQGSITVAPAVVNTGGQATVTLTSSGFFDFSEVLESQISVRPANGISNVKIVWASAQQLRLSFNVAEDATTDQVRALLIKNNAGATIVALDLAFRLGTNICRPACVAPQRCDNNVCIGCSPACAAGERCEGTVCRRADACPCSVGAFCDNGVCRPNQSGPPICQPPCGVGHECVGSPRELGTCVKAL